MALNSRSRIPLEIYPLIIDHIDRKSDLLSMLVSSKAIFADVERKLYSNVWFSDDDKIHILFLESVLDARRPHLPGLVYSYSCATDSWSYPALSSLIKRALVTFTNLKQLRCNGEDIFTSVLSLKNPPFQLELFHWIGPGPVRSCDEIGILRLLTTQHTLKTLFLFIGGPQFSQISPLQNLQTLENIIGSPSHILSLLPPVVPIKRIHILLGGEENIVHFPPLMSLRVLSFDYGSPPISVIAERFGTVKVLGLVCLESKDLPDLYRLSSLHTLVITEVEDVINFTKLTDQAFRNMKFLQHIFVSTDGLSDHSCQYLRWDRHGQKAVLVDGLTVETNWWSQL